MASVNENSGWNRFHTAMDVLGMVPVVGEAFDLANGVVYAARGDKLNAAISFAALVPVGGQAATGSRLAYKAGKEALETVSEQGARRIVRESTSAVTVTGKRAIDMGQSYEKGVRELYGDIPFSERTFSYQVNGQTRTGVADTVIDNTAVEAKFVETWGNSLRNPASKNGDKPWALAEQQKMLDQARAYDDVFDDAIYHTNSTELADHYTKVFQDAGIENFKFVITPVQ
ncbi:MAG: hypothetical protein ACRBC3_08065 [Burkholderiaceae bacterium]